MNVSLRSSTFAADDFTMLQDEDGTMPMRDLLYVHHLGTGKPKRKRRRPAQKKQASTRQK
jgi:hypothetical protein